MKKLKYSGQACLSTTGWLRELQDAFENCSSGLRHFLDLQTGEIITLTDYDEDSWGEEDADKGSEEVSLREKIDEDDGTRYIALPEADSGDDYRDMEDFTRTIADENLKEKLYIAINGKGCFRRFKDVLLNHPDERERWFKFKDAKTRERVEDWLEANKFVLEK